MTAQTKPKWQRARIVKATLYPEMISHEVWVWIEPPRTITARGRNGGQLKPAPRLRISLMQPKHPTWTEVLKAEKLELLARDENDFADDVPLISWEQFLAECRKEQPNAK